MCVPSPSLLAYGPFYRDADLQQAEVISEKFGLSDRGPSGIDIVLDCSGAEVCIQTGMWLLKRRGKFIQVSHLIRYYCTYR